MIPDAPGAIEQERQAAAERVRASLGDIEISPLGSRVARLLSRLYRGLHHMDDSSLAAVNWSDNTTIVVRHRGELASYDANGLTQLIVDCHDECIRLAIRVRTFRYLELLFTQRERVACSMTGHPTIEEHIKRIREA